MRPRPRRMVVVLVASIAFAGTLGYAAWNSGWAGGAAGDSPPLDPVVLPDVSRLDPAVQAEVRERHERLTAVLRSDSSRDARADAYGALGQVLLAAEQRTEAEAAFRNAQALAPGDARWPHYLGHVYRTNQQTRLALAAFGRALELDPDDVPSLIWTGELHLAGGNPAAAETALLRALELHPRSTAALAALGQAALARRDYARAAGYLEQALHLEPGAAGLHYPLGMAYRGLGDSGKAEVHLRRARGDRVPQPADPLIDEVSALLQGAGAYEARGMAALEARNWGEAVDNLRRAVALAPANAVAHLNLGTALSLAGDPDAAERALLDAVRLDPALARAHFTLGLLAQDARRWDDAIARLTAAVQQDGAFVDARLALADALRRTGRAADAVRHYREALALDPAAAQARFGLAMALVGQERFAEARAVLEQAVTLHADQPGLPHALARILAAAPAVAVRDGPRALVLMQPLVTLDAGAAVAETMGMVMAELGRFDEAVAWQERAIAAAARGGQPGLAAQLQDNLRLYRAGHPCRTPWRRDDPVMAVR